MAPNFELMADVLCEKLGIDRETALWYADIIGDTPEIDDDGNAVVRNDETGEVMARFSTAGW